MSERFEKIYSLPQNLYTPKSPLLLAAGALLLDKKLAKFVVQLKFVNISSKIPVAVTVKIIEMDSEQRNLGTETEFTYINISADRGIDFGAQTPIYINNSNIRVFNVIIKKVTFVDASVYYPEKPDLPEALPNNISIQEWLEDGNAIDEYFNKHEKDAKERLRIDKERRYKKCIKISAIASLVVVAVIAFIIVTNTVIIPNLKYNDAVSLMKQGKYLAAADAFYEMLDYKDSEELYHDCYINFYNQNNIITTTEYMPYLSINKLGHIKIKSTYSVPMNIVIPHVLNGVKVTEIGFYSFENCTGLTTIAIPNSIKWIGEGAFNNCRELRNIIFQGTIDEWRAIEKSEYWNIGTGEYIVRCNNGNLSKTESK